MSEEVSAWTIARFTEQVANTERLVGGGAVAAMSLAGAAATAELVFRLSAGRRKTPEEQRRKLDEAVALCQHLRKVFQQAIDEDIASLEELMDSQSQLRAMRKSRSEPSQEHTKRASEAVDAAIESPLRVARDAKRLLQTISELQHLARPFTASDLGASAATCSGAITSLLLMAEVNLGMVNDPVETERIAQEIEDLYSQTQTQADEIIRQTRAVIRS